MNICVFGAASKTIDEKYIRPVEDMGEYLAKGGHNLVCGTIHGVVPEFFKKDLYDFVNWDCDELTITETMRERKGVMEDLADAFIITPGGAGTFEEFFEILTLKQLGQHRKPIAIYNIDGYYNSLIDAVKYAIETEFIKASCEKLYQVFDETQFDEMIWYLENDDMQGMTVHDLK